MCEIAEFISKEKDKEKDLSNILNRIIHRCPKELIQMNENKTNINCLSLIYLPPNRNPYKIRKN